MRRLGIATLWFVAFLLFHELAWSVFGSPRVLGLAIGIAAAAFVIIDPLGIVDSRPRRTAAIARRRIDALARLEGVPKG
jgi:hypothetical protein